jgi:hypothetical protein
MQYIFIILNLGHQMVSGHPQDVAILPWTSDTCSIVRWIGANTGVNGLENTKTSCSFWYSKPGSSSYSLLCYPGSKQQQQTENIQKAGGI